jgi:hypothetical protein
MRRLLSGLLLGTVVVAMSLASPAASQEAEVEAVGGGAFGIFADLQVTPPDAGATEEDGSVSFIAGGESTSDEATPEGLAVDIDIAPQPEVVLPPEGGGPFTDSVANFVVDFPEPILDGFVESFDVSTEGALGSGGFARSSAEGLGVALSGIDASAITSSCESTLAGSTGDSEMVDFVIGEADIDGSPEPNTVLDDSDIPTLGDDVTITLNAQETVEIDGIETFVVTAVRVEAAPGGTSPTDGIFEVAQSRCGVLAGAATPAVPTVVTPSFTG